MSQATKRVTLALDVMGADRGPLEVIKGLAIARDGGLDADVILFGHGAEISAALAEADLNGPAPRVVECENVVAMDAKPTDAVRKGKNSSMWRAIAAHKDGEADAVVSSGNTGALMAMSVLQLRMIEGIDRPAIGALWPTKRGKSVVLDVGANVEASAKQLVQFAIMGEAYYRALMKAEAPSVGLLNVGNEDLKGHTLIRTAATILREADREMNFVGFVEGNDISGGGADVIVTDGFTGNIALKTAEGTARLVGAWMKDALTASPIAKLGALMMRSSLMGLKHKMDPSRVNGAPLLGLNGLVVKSHGGSEALGVASALRAAATLADHPFRDEIKRTVATVERRAEERQLEDGEETPSAAAE